jgi:hypothetical protein
VAAKLTVPGPRPNQTPKAPFVSIPIGCCFTGPLAIWRIPAIRVGTKGASVAEFMGGQSYQMISGRLAILKKCKNSAFTFVPVGCHRNW